MKYFVIEREFDMPASAFWSILSDFSKSPGLNIVSTIEKNGDSRDVGTIRKLRIGNIIVVREKVEKINDPDNFVYSIRVSFFKTLYRPCYC